LILLAKTPNNPPMLEALPLFFCPFQEFVAVSFFSPFLIVKEQKPVSARPVLKNKLRMSIIVCQNRSREKSNNKNTLPKKHSNKNWIDLVFVF